VTVRNDAGRKDGRMPALRSDDGRHESFELRALLAAGAGQGLDLYARHSNPRFVRILRILGFDVEWARAEGAYLYDRRGQRYLDWLGGFGMFNVGRNNPVVGRALREVLALETPSLPQLGLSDLPGMLAEALVRVAPASLDRVLFVNSGAEAVEAALKVGRGGGGGGGGFGVGGANPAP
jgi:ornithine--oxo-acid transaminase